MPMGIGLGIGVTRGGGVGWWPAGSELALEFDNQRGFNSIDRTKTTPDSILTYTNPSAKMVYGSDGVLRYAPHNLLTASQTIGGSGWLNSGVPPLSVTQNAAIAPNGTTTAALISLNTSGGTYQLSDVPTDQRYSATIWLKRVSTSGTVRIGNPQTPDGGRMVVDLALLGDDWEKIIPTHPAVSDYREFTGRISKGGIYLESRGTAVSFYAWGAQNNLGATLLTYIPTTTAARYSLPIDHNPTTFEPLGVLIEEQRTNLLLRSEQFNNTGSWAVPAGATIAADNITAPDGTLTADKLTRAATSGVALGYGNMGNGLALTAGVHTLSYFAKADTQTSFTVALVTGGKALGSEVVFNLSAGTAGAITNYGATTGSVATIQELNGGWYRCSLTVTVTTATWFMQAEMPSAGAYWLWGAQLEAGAFATSYIPTTNNPLGVTRLADQVSILTSAFAYNAVESTMVETRIYNSVSPSYLYLTNISAGGGVSNIISFVSNSGNASFRVRSSASDQVDESYTALTLSGEKTLAAAVKENDFAFIAQGGVLKSDPTGIMPIGVVGLNFSTFGISSHIKRFTYFPTRRSNADLQVLTRGDDLVWGIGDYLVWGSGNNLTW